VPMFVQLNPTIPLDTPKGPGYAHFVIDYSQEHHLMWGVFLDDGGACWIFENPEVRLRANPTLGRGGNTTDKFFIVSGVQYRIARISDADMTVLYVNHHKKHEEVPFGYPLYYSPDGRYYPRPSKVVVDVLSWEEECK
jgi:hypothetical protein